jgi:hypothetical protein
MAYEREEKNQVFWIRLKKEIRQLSKGMRANLDGVMRKQKEELGSIIEGLDRKAENRIWIVKSGSIDIKWRGT